MDYAFMYEINKTTWMFDTNPQNGVLPFSLIESPAQRKLYP